MKKIKEEAWKQCPKCGKTASQVRAGYNRSGSVRRGKREKRSTKSGKAVELDELVSGVKAPHKNP